FSGRGPSPTSPPASSRTSAPAFSRARLCALCAPRPTAPRRSGSPRPGRRAGGTLGRSRFALAAPMIDKVFVTALAAVSDVQHGATVMIGGFGTAGQPSELVDALIEQGAR